MKRSTLFIAAGAVLAFGTSAFVTQAARQPLFSPLPSPLPAATASMKSAPGLARDASYRALATHRATESLQVLRADASLITADTDVLPLGLGDLGTAYRQQITRNPGGTLVWRGTLGKRFDTLDTLRFKATGEIADDPNNSVTIVRNGDKLTGTIRRNGQLYNLRPLKSGGHAIVRVDERKMSPDHSPATYARLFREAAERERIQGPAQNRLATRATRASSIRVEVAYTTAAADASGDIVGLIDLAIAETNQGYANSGVNASLVLAARYRTSYVASGDTGTDLSRFRGTTDGYMDGYHTSRNNNSADLNVLIVEDGDACGSGTINASASSAFAVVKHDCATGYYSFGHELGHNFGARHDPATDSNTTPYAYGHGYRSPTNAWRTIMAYNCSPSCPRINYWSNPSKTYGGQAMGTTSKSNNTRVLNERAATVAAFR